MIRTNNLAAVVLALCVSCGADRPLQAPLPPATDCSGFEARSCSCGEAAGAQTCVDGWWGECNCSTQPRGCATCALGEVCARGPDGALTCARRCVSESDCPGMSCTPSLTVGGAPEMPYVCTRSSCRAYGGCPAAGSCPDGFCNVCDAAGNCFCARSCDYDADCGGSARCVAYPSSLGRCAVGKTFCAPR